MGTKYLFGKISIVAKGSAKVSFRERTKMETEASVSVSVSVSVCELCYSMAIWKFERGKLMVEALRGKVKMGVEPSMRENASENAN